MRRFFVLVLLLGVAAVAAFAQSTGMRGRVVDGKTGEALPFVQIYFVGTQIGTLSDMEGNFSIADTVAHAQLRFQMLGYESLDRKLTAGRIVRDNRVELQPTAQTMKALVVTEKRGRTRYSRRNNEAVDLVKEVIAHRDQNRVEALAPRYRRKAYEKITLSLDDFHPNFDKRKLWQQFRFLEHYIDRTPYDDTPILTLSMRERLMEQYYDRSLRTLITARRMEGVDQMLDREGLDANLEAMFAPVDIYDADIEIMLNHFVGPLSPTLAVAFYRYYITDTTEVDGTLCAELSFVPANKDSYGFTGQMYIALDGTYAVTQYVMKVSPRVNLNFVHELTIMQSYTRVPADGRLVPERSDAFARIYVHRRLQKVYAHQTRLYTEYDFSPTVQPLPDSLFATFSKVAVLPEAGKVRRRVWNEIRPLELSMKETFLDSLKIELLRVPGIDALRRVAEVLVSGYVPTHSVRDSSRWDFGPVFNTVSWNGTEGLRLRVGGMTTARLNPQWFAEGYAAYGFADARAKGRLSLVRTFAPMKHRPYESPIGWLALTGCYDLESPGRAFERYEHDNLLMSSTSAAAMQYVGSVQLRLRKVWQSHIGVDTYVEARNVEPTGTLHYDRLRADGNTEPVKHFSEWEWIGQLSFDPSTAQSSGKSSSSQSAAYQHAPTLHLTQRMGSFDGTFLYGRTDLSAHKRFWLGTFGYVESTLRAGKVWSRTPFPKLYFPSTNVGWLLSSQSAFSTMRPLEYVMDSHASLFLSYHMKGLLLRHVPLVKRLRLREVVSFNVVKGSLADRNDPSRSPEAGLFLWPEGTQAIGSTPYAEWAVGIENIFQILRVEYVRRLTYTDGLTSRQRGALRFELRISL
ncbi:MAG: carboxypeptidase-like regulatory domain-containing protein [Bacteroidales bacterium]|nr:carboxypeptidase-like regulatory domain-containing protein [Bacteroidales bacterium]